MSSSEDREILNIEEAAALLGVSIKTFNKVLHSEDLPARKIGREWKFSRSALVAWVGSGRSSDFYRENSDASRTNAVNAHRLPEERKARRTAGWRIDMD